MATETITETAKTETTETKPGRFTTTLNYYLPPELGGSTTYQLGSANDGVSNSYLPADVIMTDLRTVDGDWTLDQHGFQYVKHHTNYDQDHEWADRDQVRTIYTKDVVQILKEHTGATTAFARGCVFRGAHDESRPEQVAKYATMVHCDWSYSGAHGIACERFPEVAEKLDKCRWAMISVWRPIKHNATRTPLAVCDARSVQESELREVSITPTPGRRIPRGTYGMWHVAKPDRPDQHKWYYMSDMTPDEVLLIKIFDSATRGGIAKRTAHSAFTTPWDHGEARDSVEARCLVLWEDQPKEGLGDDCNGTESGS